VTYSCVASVEVDVDETSAGRVMPDFAASRFDELHREHFFEKLCPIFFQ
jgi:hypothetical protein